MSRPKRDLYVVAIPRGMVRIMFPRESRAKVARRIRDALQAIGGSGVRVWPETREQTAQIAAGLGLTFGRVPGGVRVSVDGPGGFYLDSATEQHYGRKMIAALAGLGIDLRPRRRKGRSCLPDRRTGAAPQSGSVPARRAGDKVRKPSPKRRSARAGS
jgi:hypothetical protein